jgi:hypothetical protein
VWAHRRADQIIWSRRCRVTFHAQILASWIFQRYVLGTATVWRISFGAMQLPGYHPGPFHHAAGRAALQATVTALEEHGLSVEVAGDLDAARPM